MTVIRSIVPGAELHVYFAPADARGMVDAVTSAVFAQDAPSVISISLGHQEDFFTGWARTAISPLLYGESVAANCFRSVTEGTNGRYRAQPGWDPCTGLGTPDGTRLLQALTGFA